jgi:hypothetical protein
MQLSIIGTSDTSSPDVYNHYRADHKPSLVTFVDHNWRGWRRVSLFAGAGVGMSAVDWEFYEYRSDLERAVWDTYRDRSFVFNPRVGAEFFNRVRLTVEYKWMVTASEYSFFGLTVGGVFGGGRKR